MSRVPSGNGPLPLPTNVVPVPRVQQAQGYSCGAAATLQLLRYWCVEGSNDIDESALYTELGTTTAQGTEPEPMVALLRRSGLVAEYRHGDVRVEHLERAVDAREPPVVDLQAWSDHDAAWKDTWDAGHYVLMVGYDAERLYFADPSRATPEGYAFLPRAALEERWHDLAGPSDARLERMALFVRGTQRWRPNKGEALPPATQLG